jgi:hypothetical protein
VKPVSAILPLVAMLVAASAAPAAAGEATCLWNSMAPATQDRLLAAYTKEGVDGVADAQLEAAEARRQMRRCAELGGQVDPKRAVKAMGLALQGFATRNGAQLALTRLGAHAPAQLDQAWRDLGPQQRAVLHAQAEKSGADGKPAEWSNEAKGALGSFLDILDHTTLLARADPAVQRELEAYVLGRSVQEANEPRF